MLFTRSYTASALSAFAAMVMILPTAAAGPAAGTYAGPDGLTLVLSPQEDGSYRGTLTVGDVTGQLNLVEDGGRLRGSMSFNGQALAVTFEGEGDAWRLTDGQATIPFTRVREPRMAAAGGEGPEHNGQPAATAVNEGWLRYAHPMGGAFEHPADWRVMEQPGMLLLVPPDLQQGRELLIAFGGAAQGAASATGAEVVRFLDTSMQQMNPTARRVGEPTPAQTGAGQGAVYTYQGQHPTTGEQVMARIYVIIAKDMAVGFSLIGDAQTLAKRRPTMDRVFGSFTLGAAQLDPRLLGAWHGEAVFRGGPEVSANTRFTYVFREDGTIISGSQAGVNVALQGQNREYNRGGATGTTQNVTTGRWSAADGRLTIFWSDGGQRSNRYVVRGNTLEFRDQNGKLLDFMER